MGLIALLASILFSAPQVSCYTDRVQFAEHLDNMVAGADDSLKRSAFPYADLLYDRSDELFDGLAVHDTGYTLSGVTWMWDINPTLVLVIRAYPQVEGKVCVSQYLGDVVAFYGTPFKLPSVRIHGQ